MALHPVVEIILRAAVTEPGEIRRDHREPAGRVRQRQAVVGAGRRRAAIGEPDRAMTGGDERHRTCARRRRQVHARGGDRGIVGAVASLIRDLELRDRRRRGDAAADRRLHIGDRGDAVGRAREDGAELRAGLRGRGVDIGGAAGARDVRRVGRRVEVRVDRGRRRIGLGVRGVRRAGRRHRANRRRHASCNPRPAPTRRTRFACTLDYALCATGAIANPRVMNVLHAGRSAPLDGDR